MCGRFLLTAPTDVLKSVLGVASLPAFGPRWNIAPTQPILAARRSDEGREAVLLHWGLIPFWADDPSVGNRMINARSETAADKPAFRKAFEHRRCLIPASGFYEWKKISEKKKQPVCVVPTEWDVMCFAGLWEHWHDKSTGEAIESCTILTTDANEELKPIHDRMPVVLEPEAQKTWLSASASASALKGLMKPLRKGLVRTYEVSRRVNSPKNDEPSVAQPAGGDSEEPDEGGQRSLF